MSYSDVWPRSPPRHRSGEREDGRESEARVAGHHQTNSPVIVLVLSWRFAPPEALQLGAVLKAKPRNNARLSLLVRAQISQSGGKQGR